jgi:trimeric autotransporter adhesin
MSSYSLGTSGIPVRLVTGKNTSVLITYTNAAPENYRFAISVDAFTGLVFSDTPAFTLSGTGTQTVYKPAKIPNSSYTYLYLFKAGAPLTDTSNVYASNLIASISEISATIQQVPSLIYANQPATFTITADPFLLIGRTYAFQIDGVTVPSTIVGTEPPTISFTRTSTFVSTTGTKVLSLKDITDSTNITTISSINANTDPNSYTVTVPSGLLENQQVSVTMRGTPTITSTIDSTNVQYRYKVYNGTTYINAGEPFTVSSNSVVQSITLSTRSYNKLALFNNSSSILITTVDLLFSSITVPDFYSDPPTEYISPTGSVTYKISGATPGATYSMNVSGPLAPKVKSGTIDASGNASATFNGDLGIGTATITGNVNGVIIGTKTLTVIGPPASIVVTLDEGEHLSGNDLYIYATVKDANGNLYRFTDQTVRFKLTGISEDRLTPKSAPTTITGITRVTLSTIYLQSESGTCIAEITLTNGTVITSAPCAINITNATANVSLGTDGSFQIKYTGAVPSTLMVTVNGITTAYGATISPQTFDILVLSGNNSITVKDFSDNIILKKTFSINTSTSSTGDYIEDVEGTATSASATQDAAAEARDAANAATDAANAAAEAAEAGATDAAAAADAATAAAQDASDAVAALSSKVSELVSSLKKQITALTNLVIKIQQKDKA